MLKTYIKILQQIIISLKFPQQILQNFTAISEMYLIPLSVSLVLFVTLESLKFSLITKTYHDI